MSKVTNIKKNKRNIMSKDEKLAHLESSFYITDEKKLDDKGFLLNYNDKTVRPFHKIGLNLFKDKDTKSKWMEDKYIRAVFKYSPYGQTLSTDGSQDIFNPYNPPNWKKGNFFDGDSIPNEHLHPLLDRFFKHLFPCPKSREYVFDWLSTAVTNKNYTFLCLVGAKGVGKGVFSELISNVMGKSNSGTEGNKFFKATFNGHLLNKQFLNLDEMHVKTSEHEDRLKMLSNDFIDIEGKGEMQLTARNYINVLFTSNKISSLKLTPDQRRYSIIDLTEVKLFSEDGYDLTKKEIDKVAKDTDIADSFGRFLFNRVVLNEMNVPFKGAQYNDVYDAQLSEWKLLLRDDVLVELSKINQEVNFKAIQMALVDKLSDPTRMPGLRKIAEWLNELGGKYTVKRSGSQYRVVFNKEEV